MQGGNHWNRTCFDGRETGLHLLHEGKKSEASASCIDLFLAFLVIVVVNVVIIPSKKSGIGHVNAGAKGVLTSTA